MHSKHSKFRPVYRLCVHSGNTNGLVVLQRSNSVRRLRSLMSRFVSAYKTLYVDTCFYAREMEDYELESAAAYFSLPNQPFVDGYTFYDPFHRTSYFIERIYE